MKKYGVIFYLISGLLQSYEYTLSIAAIFKDEAPYFKEWIEYHKIMGVEHFRLYNNNSTDDYLAVLEPYIASGEVTLIDFPSGKKSLKNWTTYTQWPAMKDAILHFKGVSKWLALIDIDEFLFPLEDPDMISFLSHYDHVPAVVLNWQCFGTSLINDIPEGKLMIETLTMKADEYSVRNLPVKSIVHPEAVDVGIMAWSPHTYHYLSKDLAIFPDGTKREETLDISKWEIRPFKAVINHYVHRTERYFWACKIPKKKRMENGGCAANQKYIQSWHDDCNKVVDDRIFRFIPALKEKVRLSEM